MKLDKEAVARLLSLNDAQLEAVLVRLAGENGIDLGGLTIRPSDIASVRRALSMATDEDIARAAQHLGQFGRGKE